MKSIYIHIPFCKNICTYCDFPKVCYNDEMVNEYLIALENEIKSFYTNEEISTLYIGGGTPSILNIEQNKKLKEIIALFNLNKLEEFTFECNIDDINTELLKFLKDVGVNRLSIGIQSFNQEKLKFLGRSSNYKDALSKIYLLKEYGFDNINLDLMFAIPNETFKDLKKDLKLFLKLRPNHLSCYSLIIENNTILSANNTLPIDEDLENKMYYYIDKKLRRYKYSHYEVSNYALDGKKSLHNLTYWKNEEYYGFGLGAHGYIKGFRYENTRSLTDYINGKFRLNEILLSKQEIMENELMLGLRLINGINLKDFYDKYEVNLQDVFPIKPLVKNKDLLYKDGNIFINPEKIYLMNEILLKLI